METQIITPVSPEKWDDIVKNTPGGTFFHTYTWAKILSESYGYEIATKLFIFSDGTNVLFPLMRTFTKLGIFRQFESMPFSTYGGPLPADIGDEKLAQILAPFGTRDSLTMIPSPLFSRKHWTGLDHAEFSTHILPLGNGFDTIWNVKFSGKVRNQCRKAEKEGYQISVDNSLEAFRWFGNTYQKGAVARGEITYSFTLYEAMSKNAGERIKLWCAKKDEKLVGCLPALYGPRDVFYWSVAIDPEHIKFNLNNLLLKVAIEDACNRGYEYFNFGASFSDGRELESVAKYKASFGTDRIEYSIYLKEGYLYRISKQISRRSRGLDRPKKGSSG